MNAHAGFAGCCNNFFPLAADQLNDLVFHLFGHSARKVHFIEDGDDFEIILQSQVQVRNRLRLDTLCCVNNQQSAFAGSDGT
ncbi:hypothetical protein GALL_550940 [mine drainage metagenome]|uniref:Uncharacterized protein n=1 Tax=mine drainage metagenome TaxID=410659 RepID=A0A1J5NX76_9ZZZZ